MLRKTTNESEISMTNETANDKSNLKMEGEGSREGSRSFQKSQHEFAESGKVEKKAKEAAAALDGDDADELELARAAAAKGHTPSD